MTAAELIEFLKAVPPETPVVKWSIRSEGFVAPEVQSETMHYINGVFSKFVAETLEYRNDTKVVAIR